MTWRISIRAKLITAYLTMAIPLIALLGFGFYERYQSQINNVYKSREEASRLVAANFSSFVQGISTTISSAGHAIVKTDMSTNAIIAYLSEIRNEHPEMASISYVSLAGNVIASTDPKKIGKNVSFRSSFQQIISGKEIALGGFWQNLDGYSGFVITSGIREGGRLVAVMMATINAAMLDKFIPAFKTAGACLYDSKGTLVFESGHPDIDSSDRKWERFSFIKKALRGDVSRSDKFTSPVFKEDRFMVALPIKDIGWVAGSSISANKALAPIKEDMIKTGSLALAIFILASGFSLVIGNLITKPIIELSKKARLIGEGELGTPIEIRVNDEIGVLAHELNDARTKLLSSFKSMNLLLEASSSLNRTLDIRDIASTMSKILSELLNGSRVSIVLLDEENREVFVLNADNVMFANQGLRIPLPALPSIYRRLYKRKRPVVVNVENPNLNVEARNFLLMLGSKSMLICPISIGGKIIGHLVIDRKDLEHGFNESEIKLVEGIAKQAAVAIDNAMLYARKKELAETLQQALLTIPLNLPGVEINHIYEAAIGTFKVGGDFYDLFRPEQNKIGFVIGDVSGKGIEAAAVTSVVKSTIRAFAYKSCDVAKVMSDVNQALYKQVKQHQFITATFGILDTESGRLEIVNAGHPDPIIYDTSNCSHLVSNRNLPLGITNDVQFEVTQSQLVPGDTIILYTDGLTEARSESELFGEDRVIEIIKQLQWASAQDIIKGLVDSAKSFSGGNLLDDVAIISLRLENKLCLEDKSDTGKASTRKLQGTSDKSQNLSRIRSIAGM